MHLATIQHSHQTILVMMKDNALFSLKDFIPDAPITMIDLLQRGEDYIDFLEDTWQNAVNLSPINPKNVTFLPPVLSTKMIGVGLNYVSHTKETDFSPPSYPVFFARYPSSIVGHGEPIIAPKESTKTDYEGELAVVIGKRARYIGPDQAHAYIAGYTIFNDVTVRDYQGKSSQWLIGKNFDQSGSMGPYIVTKNALPPLGKGLTIQTFLNKHKMQHESTSNMIFDIATLIATITEAITLDVGDVIITGTPEGVGYRQNPPRYLSPHDHVEVRIEEIGTLHNPVLRSNAPGHF